jgi:predicted secreted protein
MAKDFPMIRFLIALACFSFASTANAADGAKFRPIGFSKDTRYFAFEQYGVQDGSGFAYANVFVLDILKDEWAKNTPINVLLEDETLSVAAVRAKAKQQSASVLSSLSIDTDAEILAANPFTEVIADRSKLTFHDHYNNAMGMFGSAENQGSWELSTRTVAVPLPEGCESDLGVVGYKLELKNTKTGAVKLLHEDKSIPKSRFCAVGYDIEAVVQPVGGTESGQMVAIIGVFRQGFEGADRRFIAIPLTFN